MSGRPDVLSASFRDPRGHVFAHDGVLYRQLNEAHRADYEHLMASGLYDALVGAGELITHVEDDVVLATGSPAAYILRPELVPFVSYPYEWSWSQLRDAALCTLSVQSTALRHGMTLRDASAYNIAFHRGRPVLIDTTSLGLRAPGAPWVAYRQFCQHFLAPLALMSYRDVRLGRLLREYLDGVPLDLAAALLPRRTMARPGLAMHIRLHARSQRRHEDDEEAAAIGSFSDRSFEGLISSLRAAVEGLHEPEGASAWREYYEQADHYSDDAARAKEEIVGRWLEGLRPGSVWDLGANTGRFSRLATAVGADTVAFDLDPFCVEELYREARAAGEERLSVAVMDLTDPSPGLGWANEERSTLPERGTADVALALALVHHLAIAGNVPLPMIADWFANLCRTLIIEFVPRDDVMVRRLLRDREDIFTAYSLEDFEAALGQRFRVLEREAVGDSGRTLFCAERS